METSYDWTRDLHTKDEIEDGLEKLYADYLCQIDIDDAMCLIEKLRRLAYAEGFNKAARLFGKGDVEFFKGDV